MEQPTKRSETIIIVFYIKLLGNILRLYKFYDKNVYKEDIVEK